jgi:hypothetical protein
VKAIRSNAFRNSDLLLSMSVDPGNTYYSSIDGVLFNADQTILVNCPEGRAGAYAIPSGVTALGDHAFYGCALLTDVTIPDGLAQIGAWAFERCTSLSEVVLPDTVAYLDGGAFARCSGLADIIIPSNVYGINNYAFWECSALSAVRFLGDAPSIFGTDVFLGTDPDLLIQYSSTNSGFFSPVWMGSPATSWFVDNELDADVDLAQDLNGDGIDLLMAYALNLDPDLDLSGSLPPVEIDVDSMGMTFYAASPGVTYIVDTGEDLETWSTNSVSLTGLDMQYRRTATVDLTAPHRFLRLRVSK